MEGFSRFPGNSFRNCSKVCTELNRQIDNQRLTNAFTAGGSPDAKDRLTRLIAEIDKCIALLEG